MSIGDLDGKDLEGLVGRLLGERYLLDEFIDRGGFGAVYRGIDNLFNEPVAVKVGLSYREFQKEAKLAKKVQHDNIVKVEAYGTDQGIAYLVMEFLHGDDLEKLFNKQNQRLTPDQLRMFVSQIGDALAHAHQDQLIHRDLKPRNIIFKQYPARPGATSSPGKFVLLDFGIAAKLDAEGTQRNRTQDGAGTLEYMAPELLKVDPVTTPQSDIYAFGILLYQMLTGRVPYPQCDTSHLALAKIVSAISHGVPPRFAEVAPDRTIAPSVEELVMQCLEKDPLKRPQSMMEVKERFLAAYYPPPPPAPPPTVKNSSDTLRPGGIRHPDDLEAPPPPDWRRGQPPPRTSSSPWALVSGVLILILLVTASQYYWQTPIAPTSRLTVTRNAENLTLDDGSSLELAAGDSRSLIFTIEELPHGVVPEFAIPDVPPGVQIELNHGAVSGGQQGFTLSVPDLNLAPQNVPAITFRATIPHRFSPVEKTISLDIRRPDPWFPTDLKQLNFKEAADSWLCRVGKTVYASILERQIGTHRIRFRLIPETDLGDRRCRTFYAMEKLVTNSLFNEFAKEKPEFEVHARDPGTRVWEANDEYPVGNVYALEAQKFAHWLAGSKLGSLPTTTEWEVSAGYYDFLHVLESKFDQPPEDVSSENLKDFHAREKNLTLNAEVWVGVGPALNEFRDPRGNELKECSPYGCRYDRLSKGVRPTEMTATLIDYANIQAELRDVSRHGIPDEHDERLRSNLYKCQLRGLGLTDPAAEFLWIKSDEDGLTVKKIEDLSAAGEIDLLPTGSTPNDWYISFRVVLLTETKK